MFQFNVYALLMLFCYWFAFPARSLFSSQKRDGKLFFLCPLQLLHLTSNTKLLKYPRMFWKFRGFLFCFYSWSGRTNSRSREVQIR